MPHTLILPTSYAIYPTVERLEFWKFGTREAVMCSTTQFSAAVLSDTEKLTPSPPILRAMSDWMSLRELARLLARVDVLEAAPAPELRTLASGGTLRRLGAAETMVVSPETHAERLIVLVNGRARIYEPGPRDRTLTMSVAEAGTVVGVAGLAPRRRGLRVEALEPSVFCLVAREAFEELVRRAPEVGLRLSRVLAERIVVLEERLADLAHKEVPARLANAITRLAEGEGVVTPEGYRIPTRYTHQQLATMIGANREAVTKAMRRLRDAGIIEVRDRRILVVDLQALKRAAEE